MVRAADGKELIIVPAPERKIRNKDYSLRRFFVFTSSGGIVSQGRIFELLGKKWNVNERLAILLENLDKESISNFNGLISEYDINYQLINSVVYTQGLKSSARSRIESKSSSNSSLLAARSGNLSLSTARRSSAYCEPIMPISDFPQMCEDATITYQISWTTDEDNCITSLFYNYISHTCPTPPGGSGDGSGSGEGISGTTEEGGDPDYGGGGSGGGSVDPPVPTPTPCSVAVTKGLAEAFKEKMADLRTRAATDNYESAYVLNDGTYNYYNGGSTGANFKTVIPTSIFNGAQEMMHKHESAATYSIFSLDDLQTFYEIVKNGGVADKKTFTYSLTTKKGTSYILMVNDVTKFEAWGESVLRPILPTDDLLESLLKSTFTTQYTTGITAAKTNTQNELAFLSLLGYNSGNKITMNGQNQLTVTSCN